MTRTVVFYGSRARFPDQPYFAKGFYFVPSTEGDGATLMRICASWFPPVKDMSGDIPTLKIQHSIKTGTPTINTGDESGAVTPDVPGELMNGTGSITTKFHGGVGSYETDAATNLTNHVIWAADTNSNVLTLDFENIGGIYAPPGSYIILTAEMKVWRGSGEQLHEAFPERYQFAFYVQES